MRNQCCHTFLAFILKFLNFLQAFVGVSIIIYSSYMLEQWHRHKSAPPPPYSRETELTGGHITSLPFTYDAVSAINFNSPSVPAPWFIYAFMGIGIVICCITCVGHVAAEAINGCCLCFYSLLSTVFILLELSLVAFIALDHHWQKDLPFDPTGELNSLSAFIKSNAMVFEWFGITLVSIQVLSLLLAIILRSLVSSQRVDHDIEGDDDAISRTREPLLNPSQASLSTRGSGKVVHSDIWSSRMKEKYGFNSSDVKNDLLNKTASDMKPIQ